MTASCSWYRLPVASSQMAVTVRCTWCWHWVMTADPRVAQPGWLIRQARTHARSNACKSARAGAESRLSPSIALIIRVPTVRMWWCVVCAPAGCMHALLRQITRQRWAVLLQVRSVHSFRPASWQQLHICSSSVDKTYQQRSGNAQSVCSARMPALPRRQTMSRRPFHHFHAIHIHRTCFCDHRVARRTRDRCGCDRAPKLRNRCDSVSWLFGRCENGSHVEMRYEDDQYDVQAQRTSLHKTAELPAYIQYPTTHNRS